MMDLKNSRSKARVAVAGLGAIGTSVRPGVGQGIEGLTLTAVSAQNAAKHRGWLDQLTSTPEMLPIDKLAEVADIVVECAPSKLVRSIVAPVVKSGKTAVVLSVGALLDNEDLIDLAKRWRPDRGADRRADRARRRDGRGRRHHSFSPPGDAKAAQGRRGAASRRKQDRDRGMDRAAGIFEGRPREAARGFPANLNVGVALSLAGIGADLTRSKSGPIRRSRATPTASSRFCSAAFFDVDRDIRGTRRRAGSPRCR